MPLMVDLFCGAGGAAMGYYDAGFDVVGVDVKPQPNYPFKFVQADAMDFDLSKYDVVHASPPCQAYSSFVTAKGTQANYPNLVAATRAKLTESGLPYVIENITFAPMQDYITLCGEMFGLGVLRHRRFESNLPLVQPAHKPHRGRVAGYRHGVWHEGPYLAVYGRGGGKGSPDQWRKAMDIEWMSVKEMAQAIPPAYTKYVGEQVMSLC